MATSQHFTYLILALASVAGPVLAQEKSSALQADAWLIGHGIETSQWRDQACKRRARALVDETRLTQARLDEALQLALKASEVRCRGRVADRTERQQR